MKNFRSSKVVMASVVSLIYLSISTAMAGQVNVINPAGVGGNIGQVVAPPVTPVAPVSVPGANPSIPSAGASSGQSIASDSIGSKPVTASATGVAVSGLSSRKQLASDALSAMSLSGLSTEELLAALGKIENLRRSSLISAGVNSRLEVEENRIKYELSVR